MATPADDRAPSANPEAEERIQFMLRLRARGIRDLRLLRALERAPRSLFMPQRYADVAARDIALPIGGGQTSPPPSVVAAMIEALDPPPRGRVLEVGAGQRLRDRAAGATLGRSRLARAPAHARARGGGAPVRVRGRQRPGRMGRRARLRRRRRPLRRDPRPRRGRVAADPAAGAACRGRRAGGRRRRRACGRSAHCPLGPPAGRRRLRGERARIGSRLPTPRAGARGRRLSRAQGRHTAARMRRFGAKIFILNQVLRRSNETACELGRV